MAQKRIRIKMTRDDELVDALENIANDLNLDKSKIRYVFRAESHLELQISYESLRINPQLTALLSIHSRVFTSVDMRIENSTLSIQREDAGDFAVFSPHQSQAIELNVQMAVCIYKHLPIFTHADLDSLLGPQVAEFYQVREASLSRLEDMVQNIEADILKQHVRLEETLNRRRAELENEYRKLSEVLENKYQDMDESLKAREDALARRISDLDDRSSKHARRQIRDDLKKVLASRNQEFSLTRKTSRKRYVIHAIFIGLVLFSAFEFAYSVYASELFGEGKEDWGSALSVSRTILAGLVTVISLVFYIRWNDRWFQTHADEEFKLKRLDLDIDRASWVVEMALEWREEKGTEIPIDLLASLTHGLFGDGPKTKITKHPNEDLASTLVRASSSLNLNIPGLGSVTLDRKGIKEFNESISSQDSDG